MMLSYSNSPIRAIFSPSFPSLFFYLLIYHTTRSFLTLFSTHANFYVFHTLPLALIISLMQTNRTVENIGARRLHTVIERIVEEVSFDAPDKAGETVIITEEYVKQRLGDLLMKGDMKKYIL